MPVVGGMYDQHPDFVSGMQVMFKAQSEQEKKRQREQERKAKRHR